jgi:hypothetical protein
MFEKQENLEIPLKTVCRVQASNKIILFLILTFKLCYSTVTNSTGNFLLPTFKKKYYNENLTRIA